MSRSGENRHGEVAQGGPISLSLGSLTHVGMTRSSNEDAYCAMLAPNAPPKLDALLAVADGMGGHQAGEVASTMAVQGLVRHLSAPVDPAETPVVGGDYSAFLKKTIQEINFEVHQGARRPETLGMGSTLTVAVVIGDSLLLGQVGDSRAYLSRKGRLQQLTQDHSWVAEEVRRGALTPQAARTHHRRNVLTRAIGTAPEVQADVTPAQLEQGDTLLLCSDGLHGLVPDEEIVGILSRELPQEACQSLVDRANELGGNDNITVIVARVEGLGGEQSTQSTRHDARRQRTVVIPNRRSGRSTGKQRTVPMTPALSLLELSISVLKLPFRSAVACFRLLLRRRR